MSHRENERKTDMSIQQILNDTSLCYIPKVLRVIQNSESGFDYNQMYQYAIRKINESSKPIADMNDSEIKEFETQLIETFKYKGWYKNEI